jgi:hypothetical protein
LQLQQDMRTHGIFSLLSVPEYLSAHAVLLLVLLEQIAPKNTRLTCISCFLSFFQPNPRTPALTCSGLKCMQLIVADRTSKHQKPDRIPHSPSTSSHLLTIDQEKSVVSVSGFSKCIFSLVSLPASNSPVACVLCFSSHCNWCLYLFVWE